MARFRGSRDSRPDEDQGEALRRYTGDGRLKIDNSFRERTLRLQAIGRSPFKLRLFAGCFFKLPRTVGAGLDGNTRRESVVSTTGMMLMAICISAASSKPACKFFGLPTPNSLRWMRPRLCAAAAIK